MTYTFDQIWSIWYPIFELNFMEIPQIYFSENITKQIQNFSKNYLL